MDRKLLYWEASTKKDFTKFPIEVQKDLGVALFVVQLGARRSRPSRGKDWARGYMSWSMTTLAIPSGLSIPCE